MTFNFCTKKQKHENIKIYSNIYFYLWEVYLIV